MEANTLPVEAEARNSVVAQVRGQAEETTVNPAGGTVHHGETVWVCPVAGWAAVETLIISLEQPPVASVAPSIHRPAV